MLELKTVDETVAFAKDAIENGANVVEAQKPSGKFVIAHQLDSDASGTTYNRDGEFEQDWSAKAGDWVVTACDSDGNAFIAEGSDGLKHDNSWPISKDTFENKYGAENVAENGLVEAKSIPQTFLMLDESAGVPEDGVMVHQSWGSDEMMAQGAALNITGMDNGDVYAVDPTFFAENYEILNAPEPEVKSDFPSFEDLKSRAQAQVSTSKSVESLDVADSGTLSVEAEDSPDF